MCVRACVRAYVCSCIRVYDANSRSLLILSLIADFFPLHYLCACLSPLLSIRIATRIFSSSFFFSYPPSSGNSIGRRSPPFSRKRALPPAIAAPSIAAVPRRGSTLEFGSDYSDFSVYSTRRNGGRIRTCGISST